MWNSQLKENLRTQMKQITHSTIKSRAWKKSLWQKTYQVRRRGLGEKAGLETMPCVARRKPELERWWSTIHMGAPTTDTRTEGDEAISPTLYARYFTFSRSGWCDNRNTTKFIPLFWNPEPIRDLRATVLENPLLLLPLPLPASCSLHGCSQYCTSDCTTRSTPTF